MNLLITGIRSAIKRRRLWLCLVLLSALTICDIPTAPIYGFGKAYIVAYILGVAVLKGSALIVVIDWLLSWKRFKWLGWLAVGVYGFLGIVNAGAWFFYKFGISRKLFIVLSQTNGTEVSGFLPGLISNLLSLLSSFPFWCVVAVAALLLRFINRVPQKIFACTIVCGSILGLGMFVSFAMNYPYGRSANIMALRIPKYAADVYRSEKEMQALLANLKPFPEPHKVTSEKSAAVVLVVIGESASREHLSLYHYPLETSPCFDALKDSLFIYTDAIGSSATTSGNLERILTFKKDDNTYNDWYKYPRLVDLFKIAGYKCFWLSNQERVGLWSNASGALASGSDVVKYIGSENSEDALSTKFDEELLPEVEAALADSARNKLIVAHLMGSHTEYKNRYPSKFSRFDAEDELALGSRPWLNMNSAQVVAEYDNSILYTDYVVGGMVSLIARLSSPSVLVYFSDHGENVYDERDFVGREPKYVKVPFVIYANAAYRKNYPEISERVRASQNYPISTANIIYSLMTLTGTSYPLYDSADDFLSEEFIPRKRYVDEAIWPY